MIRRPAARKDSRMNFTKMHGCANDYIYVDCTKETVPNPGPLAVRLSDRRTGIGGDGMILIKPSERGDFFMEMYNADGSLGKMCGNGIRCVGKYVYDHRLTDKTELTIDTPAGLRYLTLHVEDGVTKSVTVNMGHPSMRPEDLPVLVDGGEITYPVNSAGRELTFTPVSMGNPHAVILVNETKDFPVQEVGEPIEKNPLFPEGVNVEFVKVISKEEISMRVWERGSGETWACGTGACASAYACYVRGLTGPSVTVHLLGGDLFIRYDEKEDVIYMTGPAVTVFEGTVETD